MARYADIIEIASKETVHELMEPGSGIGKFGNYPEGDALVNAINRDNIRSPAQNPPPKMDIGAEKQVLADLNAGLRAENENLKTSLARVTASEQSLIEQKNKLLLENDSHIKALADKDVRYF